MKTNVSILPVKGKRLRGAIAAALGLLAMVGTALLAPSAAISAPVASEDGSGLLIRADESKTVTTEFVSIADNSEANGAVAAGASIAMDVEMTAWASEGEVASPELL